MAVGDALVADISAFDVTPMWATLLVTVIGSIYLVAVIIVGSHVDVHYVVSVGFCGAFITVSSFSVQTIRLWDRGEATNAVLNAIGNFVLSFIAFTPPSPSVG